MAEHRHEFDRQLDVIDVKVIELFAMVCEDLPAVTEALLSGSNDMAIQLAARDRAIDALYREIELLVEPGNPAAGARRLGPAVPADRAADRAGTGAHPRPGMPDRLPVRHLLAAELSPRCRGLIEQMGELAREMWRQTTDCWYERDGSAAPALAKVNDEMHELQHQPGGDRPSPEAVPGDHRDGAGGAVL